MTTTQAAQTAPLHHDDPLVAAGERIPLAYARFEQGRTGSERPWPIGGVRSGSASRSTCRWTNGAPWHCCRVAGLRTRAPIADELRVSRR
jgi:hypothetical protein